MRGREPHRLAVHRRRRVAVAVVAALAIALVATACQLNREAMGCLASQPDSAQDYAAAFAQRSGPWNGGDVAHVVRLDHGRLLWLFGDTYMDRSSTEFQHSSLVLQEGTCFTALTTGSPGSRTAPLTSSDTNTWDWPVGGDYNSTTGQATILSIRVAATDGTVPGWNFEVVGSDTAVVSFAADGSVSSTVGVPAPAPQGVAGLHWDSLSTVGDSVYVYGWTIDSTHVVARATTATFATGPWEYWNGSDWSTSFATAAPMIFDRTALATLNVVAVTGGYLASAKSWDTVSTDLWAWFSTSPSGPWTWVAEVADTPPVRPGWVSYDAAVVWLPGAGWTAIWSQSPLSEADQDVSLYGPRFAAVSDPFIAGLRPRVIGGGGNPFGSLDVAQGVPGGVSVAGWAIDPDTTAPIQVHVYVDNAAIALTANANRPDVAAVFPAYGADHGYTANLATGPGRHQVCAYGIDIGGGPNTQLACQTVVVPGGNPFGSLDAVTTAPGTISIDGWAIDPDTTAPIQVHIYIDNAAVAVTANGARPDVAAVFPAYGADHGYTANLHAATGRHQVCAYGINIGSGNSNTQLACRTVVVPGG